MATSWKGLHAGHRAQKKAGTGSANARAAARTAQRVATSAKSGGAAKGPASTGQRAGTKGAVMVRRAPCWLATAAVVLTVLGVPSMRCGRVATRQDVAAFRAEIGKIRAARASAEAAAAANREIERLLAALE